MSKAEAEFLIQMRGIGATNGMEREYRFHPVRRWRFDFAWPELRIAVEIEGVLWQGQGRHQTAQGLAGDCEKYNEAAIAGWRVFRFTQAQVTAGDAFLFMQRALTDIRRIDYE